MAIFIRITAVTLFVLGVFFCGTVVCGASEIQKDSKKNGLLQDKVRRWQHPASLADNLSLDGQNARTPVVAMDDKGNGIVVWSQYDGSSWRIYKSEYRKNKWLKPVSLAEALSPTGGDAKEPRLAMAANGDAVIVWEQSVNKDSYIFMAERRAGKWQLPISLDSYISPGGKFAWEPEVAMDYHGNTIIVWNQEYANSVHVVYKSEYRNGAWLHPSSIEDYINVYGGDGLRPRVAMNNQGEALITWEQDPGGRSQIFKSEYRNGAWVHPADINDHISPKSKRGSAHNAIPAMDGTGRAIIVWQQAEGSSSRIYKSEYSRGVWQHPKSLSDSISPATQTNASLNSIAMDAKGNGIIIWSLQQKRNQALYMSELREGNWKHPGVEDFFVGSKREFEFRAFGNAALSDSGKAVIVWQQRGDDGISQAFLAEYDNGRWYFPGKAFNLQGQSAANATIGASKSGNFIICWLQKNSSGNIQVYKSEFRLLKK